MANLNQVINQWPAGLVATQAWLKQRGVSSDQARKWTKSGWLVRVGHGAYARASDRLGWEGAVAGLQADGVDGNPCYWPSGLTALELRVGAHYLPFADLTLELWGLPGKQLPGWFSAYDWGVAARYRNYRLFDGEPGDQLTMHTPSGRDFNLLVSAPEWAVLEWLYVLPRKRLFSNKVVLTFEGFGILRPDKVQQALASCRSVQVKRLFLYLARESDHAWYHRLDQHSIHLGKGKRQLYAGGKLDREFQITVPQRFSHDN